MKYPRCGHEKTETTLNPGPCRTVNMVTNHSGTLLWKGNPARSWAGLTLIFSWPTKTDQIAKTVNSWPWFVSLPTAPWNVLFLSLLSVSSSLPRTHHGGRYSPDYTSHGKPTPQGCRRSTGCCCGWSPTFSPPAQARLGWKDSTWKTDYI